MPYDIPRYNELWTTRSGPRRVVRVITESILISGQSFVDFETMQGERESLLDSFFMDLFVIAPVLVGHHFHAMGAFINEGLVRVTGYVNEPGHDVIVHFSPISGALGQTRLIETFLVEYVEVVEHIPVYEVGDLNFGLATRLDDGRVPTMEDFAFADRVLRNNNTLSAEALEQIDRHSIIPLQRPKEITLEQIYRLMQQGIDPVRLLENIASLESRNTPTKEPQTKSIWDHLKED